MYAVGRLGSYISRGVYTVSAPFHPFGGAVDIVVVEQQDGSFKSSPWYVRFGKFQGVLKAKENVVDINVNGEDADFHMYLDHTGEAYFLREVDAEEGNLILSRTSSGEEMDGLDRRPMKANSWNDGVDLSDSVTQLEVSNGKVLARTGSRRSRFLGYVFGRRSVKDNIFKEDGVRTDSLEHAEIAADLLEVKWSTNLNSVRKKKDNASRLSAPDILDGVASKDFLVDEDVGMLDSSVSNTENKAFRRQATAYYEALETSRIELDGFNEQDDETMLLSSVKSGEVSVQAETSPDPELITEVTSELETLNVHGIVGDDGSCCNFVSDGKIHGSKITSPQTSSVLTESSSEPVSVEQIDDPAKEVDSCSALTVSSVSGSKAEVQDERCIEKEDEMKGLPFCDSEEASSDFVQTEGVNNSSSLDLEEEQFLFTDLDDFKLREAECIKVISLDHMDKENDSSLTSEGIETVNKSSHSDFTSPDKFVQGNLPNDGEESREEAKVISSQINIPRSSKVAGQELGGMVESLPSMRSHSFELDERFLHRPLGHSLDSNSKSSKWTLVRENVSSFIKSDGERVHNLDSQPTTEDTLNLEELKNVDTSPAVGNSSKIVETSSGSWSIWPFAFKRSRSMKDTQPALSFSRSLDAEISLEDTIVMDGEKELTKSKVNKKNIRVLSPTTEQLASLNLKEGRNIVTFTFSTAMLGKQQVDARIYLWRWDNRVVITDVDGTITKSDVLGQFMPLVGKDWSQTGVAHLFSAIKENGYHLLFLSARAISQAGLTRQFLFNLKQDGKGLPDGPVVISPDGLFPSLFREVIRRAPHEFKIACLEDIKACFPSDRNPFYAGFGNRDTDEFSYLKVGIPKGKIFIINPKGEVVVNRCDNKSYTSLHALVNGMFPPTPSSEQEDFNSWNFWKLPPPLIDI